MNSHHCGKPVALALITAMLLSACASSLSDTYVDQTGDVQLDFQSGDIVALRRNGSTMQYSYAIKGDKVTVGSTGGTVAIFQIEANDCLHSPLFTELCKPKSP